MIEVVVLIFLYLTNLLKNIVGQQCHHIFKRRQEEVKNGNPTVIFGNGVFISNSMTKAQSQWPQTSKKRPDYISFTVRSPFSLDN